MHFYLHFYILVNAYQKDLLKVCIEIYDIFLEKVKAI